MSWFNLILTNLCQPPVIMPPISYFWSRPLISKIILTSNLNSAFFLEQPEEVSFLEFLKFAMDK